jgi:hypothetical protein
MRQKEKAMKPFVSCLVCTVLAAFFISCGGGKAPRYRDYGNQNNSASNGPRVMILQASFRLDSKEPALPYRVINAADEADAASLACLRCHGPSFADLAAKTAAYIDHWGTNVNPHVYVEVNKANPHDSTVITSCLACHEQHALPLPTAAGKTATLQYCYSCHHTEDMVACGVCHDE